MRFCFVEFPVRGTVSSDAQRLQSEIYRSTRYSQLNTAIAGDVIDFHVDVDFFVNRRVNKVLFFRPL